MKIFGPRALGEHLSSDHPGDGARADGEEEDEEEGGGDHELPDVEVLGDDDEDGHQTHPDQPQEVEDPPAQPVHQGDGDERHPHHDGPHAQVGQLRLGALDTRGLEEGDGVVEDGHHAGQLLAGSKMYHQQ